MKHFITKQYYILYYKYGLYSFYYNVSVYNAIFKYGVVYPTRDKNIKSFKWANKFKRKKIEYNWAEMSKYEIKQLTQDLLRVEKLAAFE